MFIATSLSHYKRDDVRKAIVNQARDKEVSVIFDKTKFGKRPDILAYEQDVLDFAKKKVSSFHCSEELWHNPLSLGSGMKRHELDDLRKGWDLILDIDCPHWELSRLITFLFVQGLEDHGVQSISVKFSGNKGFHIAVPFEAFPETVFFDGKMRETRTLFPEVPRKIALYLLSYITSKYVTIEEGTVTFLDEFAFSHDLLESVAKQTNKELFAKQCVDCEKEYRGAARTMVRYVCSACGHNNKPTGDPEYIHCERCRAPVSRRVVQPSCMHCRSKKPPREFLNLLAVIEIDTVLLASRHLYRMPYSLHEKSGLVSIPIRRKDILTFEKKRASPGNIDFTISFLDRSHASGSETLQLLQEALSKELSDLGHIHADIQSQSSLSKDIPLPEVAIAQEHFPPCMQLLSEPMEDGKKRALFLLINFLRVSGWSKENIEEYVRKWNEGHPEPLREQYLRGQLAQIKKGKKPMPPPNCANQDYYVGLGVCRPDNLCKRIKNPAMYAKRKHEAGPKKRPKKNKKKAAQKKKKSSN